MVAKAAIIHLIVISIFNGCFCNNYIQSKMYKFYPVNSRVVGPNQQQQGFTTAERSDISNSNNIYDTLNQPPAVRSDVTNSNGNVYAQQSQQQQAYIGNSVDQQQSNLNSIPVQSAQLQSQTAAGYYGNNIPTQGTSELDRQRIPENATHPPGNHTHLTDDAIIHHHNNDPDYSAVSRYPPYVKKNGTQVVNQPFPSENKNIEASQAPQITAAYPFFQQTTPASSVPSEMPKPVLQLVPLVAKVGGNNDGVSNPIATSNTAAASESGTNQPSISGTTAVSQPVNSVYPHDDARCSNYTTQICHQAWMQRHCPEMCGNITTSSPIPPPPVNPLMQETTTTTTQQKEKNVPDDPRCKNYPIEFCNQPWMKKNCPNICASFISNNPTSGVISTPPPKTATTPLIKNSVLTPSPLDDPRCASYPKEYCTQEWFQRNCKKMCSPTSGAIEKIPAQSKGVPVQTSGCCPCMDYPCSCVAPPCPTLTPTVAPTLPPTSVCNPWPNFSPCSVTCGGGIQYRLRNCSYTDGNNATLIPQIDSHLCNLNPCPINYTEWGEWTRCVNGTQSRVRNGTWIDLGKTIVSPYTETRPCVEECVPGPWSEWTECSKTCEGGKQTRHRDCSYSNGTVSVQHENRTCNVVPCLPEFCGDWSAFTECTVTCGGGVKTRWRTCGGSIVEEHVACNEEPCPSNVTTTLAPTTTKSTPTTIPVEECIVAYLSFDTVDATKKVIYDEGPYGNDFTFHGDIEFENGNYTCDKAASVTGEVEVYYAGPGFKNSPKHGVTVALWVHPKNQLHKQSIFATKSIGSKGANFQLDLEAGKVRWMLHDPDRNNNFTVVSDAVIASDEWVHIAGTYNATTSEAKIFINAKEMANATITGDGKDELAEWNMFVAITPPAYTERFNGMLDEFYIYNCSLTSEQIRDIADTCRSKGGDMCPSPLLGVCPLCDNCVATTTQAPPTSMPPSNTTTTTLSNTNATNPANTLSSNNKTNPTPGHPILVPGNETVTDSNVENDQASEKPSDNQPSSDKSPLPPNLPKGYFPKHNKLQSETSNAQLQKVNGNYGAWGEWSPCSASCNNGTRSRNRQCNNPEPQFGGLDCSEQPELGNDTDLIPCMIKNCPIDGEFCPWKGWIGCNASCGWGINYRTRECACPPPQHGGRDCSGNSHVEKIQCQLKPCPINGNYSNWSAWSACSVSCGKGIRYRSRTCTNPQPMFGGTDCELIGPDESQEECTGVYPCEPDPGNWSPWSPWSRCSRSCGEGVITRTRSCTDPAPASGGLDCPGNPTEHRVCKLADCCDIPYKELGCYKERLANMGSEQSQAFSEMLFAGDYSVFTSEMKNVSADLQDMIMDLVCRCAKMAEEKKYTHFSLQNFTECWSGSNVAETYNQYGKEVGFVTPGHPKPWIGCSDSNSQQCPKGSLHCVGMETTNYVYGLKDVNPTDGGYGPWSNWTECSKSCGTGEQYRQRECNNPVPSFGGKNCSSLGENEQLRNCTLRGCPVDGSWSEWGVWSDCSRSLGPGQRTKQRYCNNPSPAYGGKECFGEDKKILNCTLIPEPVDCVWSSWSNWGSCNNPCTQQNGTEGAKSRYRTVYQPAMFGGKECDGEDSETQECSSNQQCARDGGYTLWSQWSSCSKSCGGGLRTRERECTNPEPLNGGKNCVEQHLGPPMEQNECNLACCPVDANVSHWSEWSACDVTCGSGQMQRTRKCDSPPPSCGGKNCSDIGPLYETAPCNGPSKCPIDGNWSDFGNWSACSLSCGYGGVQMRQRKCSNPEPQYGGMSCLGDDTESRNCDHEQTCCTRPYAHLGCFAESPSDKALPELLFDDQENIDLQNWDEWLDTLVCRCAEEAFKASYTFFGIQGLGQCFSGPNAGSTYNIHGPSDNCVTVGGKPDQDMFVQCDSNVLGKPCVGGNLTNYIYGLSDVKPRDGNYSEWSAWSNCSVSCDQGTKLRYRTCTNPSPAFGGKSCQDQSLGPNEEMEQCNMPACPVDCGFTVWSDWSGCSVTCGSGIKERHRYPTNPPASNGGIKCSTDTVQSIPCDQPLCPVNGNYSQWTEWGDWSASCGMVYRDRARYCNNPIPENGGYNCDVIGPWQERESEKFSPCPENGGWCSWSPWSLCSRSCGLGSSNRTRECKCPAPANGGTDCSGVSEECRMCNTTECPRDGGYTDWTEWSVCDKTCGNGTKTRSRSCSNPPVAGGGKTCLEQNLGDSEEVLHCSISPCPVDGGFSAWSKWSSCSEDCGEGESVRTRECNNPVPQNNGDKCYGHTIESRVCKKSECTCAQPYNGIGCRDIRSFTLTVVLKERSKNEKFQEFVCQCSAAAKQRNFTTFGLSGGKCFAIGAEISLLKVSMQCTTIFPAKPVPGPTSNVNTPKDFIAMTGAKVGNVTTEKEPCLYMSHQCDAPEGFLYLYSVGGNSANPDGRLSSWTDWGECSKSCGYGIRYSYRACADPYPSYGGKDCTTQGEVSRVESCNTSPCQEDTWGSWSVWSACSVSCGIGTIKRSRTCQSESGLGCVSGKNGSRVMTDQEEEICKLPHCSVLVPDHSNFFPWGEWTPCSTTCGPGEKHRVRNCTENDKEHLICPCPKQESVSCNNGPCPIDGGWGQWTSFSECSVTCGCGMQNRTRFCDSPAPQNNGKVCQGSPNESRKCKCLPECPANGNYTEWSSWEACDKSCGGGQRSRTRICSGIRYGGASCTEQGLGNATETEPCNIQSCPIDCELAQWSEWSACSVGCGYGFQARNRKEDPAAMYGGKPCVGDLSQTKTCYKECCDAMYKRLGCFKQLIGNDSTNPFPEPQVLFNETLESRTKYSEWDVYLPTLICRCAKKAMEAKFTHFAVSDLGLCLSGNEISEYYDKNGASTNCAARTSNVNNTYIKCKTTDKHCVGTDEKSSFLYGLSNVSSEDCGYSKWTEWSTCSTTCGPGIQERSRDDNQPPESFGGKPCTEPTSENKTCELRKCPINGGWSPWTPYQSCPVTCGNATIWRFRDCTNPTPQYGGLPCEGLDNESQICNEGPCPVNGTWNPWANWSDCSVTCNSGVRARQRTCNPPKYNGAPCEGPDSEQEICEKETCYYNPGPWGEWGDCSVSCGEGVRTRSRDCPKPPCLAGLDMVQSENCSKPECPVPCEKKMDVSFVVDMGGLLEDHFAKVKDFIIETARYLNLGANKTHFSYVPYSTIAHDIADAKFNNIKMKALTDADGVNEFLEEIIPNQEPINPDWQNNQSYLNRALRFSNETTFTQEAGMRPDAKPVLILLSDGKQDEIPSVAGVASEPLLNETIEAVKAKGVQIVSVAIGTPIYWDNLNQVISDPSFIFNVSSVDDLQDRIHEVVKAICTDIPHWALWGEWSACSVTCGEGTRHRERQCKGGQIGEGSCTPTNASIQDGKCIQKACPSAGCDKDVDLGVIANYYETVNSEEKEFELRNFIIAVASSFDIAANNTHFAFIPFSTNPGDFGSSSLQWFNNSMVANMASGDRAAKLQYLNEVLIPDRDGNRGDSIPSRALALAKEKMFSTAYGMRLDKQKILLFITNGKEPQFMLPFDIPIEEPLNAAKALGINVFVVAVGSSINTANIKQYTSENNTFTAPTYQELNITNIVQTLCKVPAFWGPWGEWSTCSATCGNGIRSRSRGCVGGNPGDKNCVPESDKIMQEPCNIAPCLPECLAKIDLGYIVDESNSIQDGRTKEEHFEDTKDFIKRTALSFDVSGPNTHFSFIPFGTWAEDRPLQWFNNSMLANIAPKDKASQIAYLNQAIQPLVPQPNRVSGLTYLNHAIDLANTKMFSLEYGMRQDVPKILILMTDGNEENALATDSAMKTIKEKGVFIIVVTIGNNHKRERLLGFVDGREEDLFVISSYNDFKSKLLQIGEAMCNASTQPQNIITTPAATTTTTTTTTLATTTPYVPFHCEGTLDLVLVIDASSSVVEQWDNMKGFLKELVTRFAISPDRAHIAIVTYSSENKQRLQSDFVNDEFFVWMAIDDMAVLQGSTRIDKALDFVRENLLYGSNNANNREGAPDVLLLLTDGKNDPGHSENMVASSNNLKDHGVFIVTVGLGSSTSFDELRQIASSRSAIFILKDYKTISTYVDNVAESLCNGYSGKKATSVQHIGYLCEPSLILKFDLVCSDVTFDESRKGNNGKLTGQFGIDAANAKCNNKVSLSSGGAIVLDGNNFRGKPLTAFTLAIWMNLFHNHNHSVFSVINSKNEVQYHVEVTIRGEIIVAINYGTIPVVRILTTEYIVPFSEWVHLTLSIDMSRKVAVIFINANALTQNQYKEVTMTSDTPLLPGDWGGYVAIGKERQDGGKQLMGAIDEPYIFSCILASTDVSHLKDHCDRYVPRVRPYSGPRYDIFSSPASASVEDLHTELQTKQPIETKYLNSFEATPFTEFHQETQTTIKDQAFAARLSAYFIPPVTASYGLNFTSDSNAALYVNAAVPSIEDATRLQETIVPQDNGVAQSKDYRVDLQAGTPYYIALYYLSSQKRSSLKLGYQIYCQSSNKILEVSAIKKSDSVYEIPRDCSDIASRVRDSPNDVYTLRLQAKCTTSEIYCDNMSQLDPNKKASEYVNLNSGPEFNLAKYHRSRLINFNTCSGSENQTPAETEQFWGTSWFHRVRINLSNLLVIRDDFTYAKTSGHPVKYGTAGDCYSKSTEDCRKGEFSIDLKNTGLQISEPKKWVSTGFPKDEHRITQFKNSNDWTAVSAHCGGSCSECEPENGHIRLKPDICFSDQINAVSGPPVTPKKRIILKNKTSKKGTKRWWRWLW